MLKNSVQSVLTVYDAATRQMVKVHGAGSMVGKDLPLKNGLDLTKPIAEQALAEKRNSKR